MTGLLADQSVAELRAQLDKALAENAKLKGVGQPSVFIACPAYGQILTGQTSSTLVGLTRSLIQANMMGGFGTLSFPDISEIRNIFLTIWYDIIKSTHLLFVDADMGFEPQLILDMIAFDKPLVGALCPKRKLPIEFAGRAKPGECKIVNGFMEVDGVGGAIMLIRRDCVDGILERDPALIDTITVKNHAAKELLDQYKVTRMLRAFDKVTIKGETFSEDLSFCLRHKQGGGDVWGNIMYNIVHVGPHEFQGRYYDHIKDLIKPEQPAVTAPAPMAIPPEVQAALMQAAE